jgi:hypothetical protein
MLTYCGRPWRHLFCDPFAYVVPRYARETIAENLLARVALVTAIMTQTGS